MKWTPWTPRPPPLTDYRVAESQRAVKRQRGTTGYGRPTVPIYDASIKSSCSIRARFPTGLEFVKEDARQARAA
jgi:hypothetical protein